MTRLKTLKDEVNGVHTTRREGLPDGSIPCTLTYAAEYLGIGYRTMERLVSRRGVRSTLINGRVYVALCDVEALKGKALKRRGRKPSVPTSEEVWKILDGTPPATNGHVQEFKS